MHHPCLGFIMIKRLNIAFLSFIISTGVLVHVLVPHHHHEGMPCFTWDTTEQTCCSHQHDEADHHDCASHQHSDHQHPGTNGCCMFEQVILLSNQDEKNEHQCDVCLHNHTNHLIQAVLLSFTYECFIADEERVAKPPYLITYHSIDASRISGLRAPPIA